LTFIKLYILLALPLYSLNLDFSGLNKISKMGKELNRVPATVENLPKKPIEVPKLTDKKSEDNASIDINKDITSK